MSNPFLGEIRMFAGGFAPSQWAFCNGQTMNINQNQALFALIGVTYGGDGVQTFLLPNLQGRLPIGQGQGVGLTNRVLGTPDGVESVTLQTANLPTHNHTFAASTVAAAINVIGPTVLPGTITTPPAGHFYVQNTGAKAPTFGMLNAQSVGGAGNGLPHGNMMPSLCISFIISLAGIFPSRN